MEIGFQLKVIYRDNDLVKVRISAWNGVFGGAADVYLGIGHLGEVAAQVQGFPRNFSDIRKVILGTFGPESAGGGVSMQFHCVDRSGHAYVETKIESDHDSAGRVQSVTLFVPIEASAVDTFVDELRGLETGKKTAASLKAAVAVSRKDN